MLHFETKAEAIKQARSLVENGGRTAAVVEKHVSKRPSFGEPDKYTKLATFGDQSALTEGGWI